MSDNPFNEYKDKRDKFQSQFIILVHSLTRTEVLEKCTHQMRLLEAGGGDNVKRAYLVHKVWNLRSYLEKRGTEQDAMNNVYLLDANDEIYDMALPSPQQTILREWTVPTWLVQRDEYFDIEYLTDLLYNTSGKHVVCVQNNTLTHTLITPTKRKILHTEETKGLDLTAYFGPDGVAKRHWSVAAGKTLVHGVSVALKNFKGGPEFIVHSKQLKPEEVQEVFRREAAAATHKELQEYLNSTTNPKLMSRIMFGANIRKCIQTGTLKTLYATAAVAAKMREKCPVDLLRTFEIVVVEPVSATDAADPVNVLVRDYEGAMGVTYY